MNIFVSSFVAQGTVVLHGNKNSALPVIAASLLWPGKVELYNIPDIVDVRLFLEFLETLSVKVDFLAKEGILKLDYSSLKNVKELRIKDTTKLSKIRAVILLLAALAVRFDKVIFEGAFSGCSLGTRPLKVHFDNLETLGFKVTYLNDYIEISTKKSANSKANLHKFNSNVEQKFLWQEETSVTATEVALMAATAFKGETIIYNAASEPHVQDTAFFLKKLGYEISGIGTNLVKIKSNGKLATKLSTKTIKYAIYSDHHEYATWLSLGGITQGNVKVVHNMPPLNLKVIDRVFGYFGFKVVHKNLSLQELENIEKQSLDPFKSVYFTNVVKASAESFLDKKDLEKSEYKELNSNVSQKSNLQKFKVTQNKIKLQNNTGVYVSYLQKVKNFKPRANSNGYIYIKPGPWPAFPVDILSLFVPFASLSETPVLFHNWMYDGGLFWALELRKAGVSVVMLDPHRVIIKKNHFKNTATFEAPYIIRATIALLMQAATLKGGGTILNAGAIARAHPDFFNKLEKLGAKVNVL